MNYSDLALLISNENPNFLYISDPKTNELYHVNNALINLMRESSDFRIEDILGKKCHEVFFASPSPCENCSNCNINLDDFIITKHYSEALDSHFIAKAKLVNIDGKILRLTFAFDSTESVKLQEQLNARLEEQTVLNSCIEILQATIEPNDALMQILEILTAFYGGDRALIIEVTKENDDYLVNCTHEHVSMGMKSIKDNLINLPVDGIEKLFKKFDNHGQYLHTKTRFKSITQSDADLVDGFRVDTVLTTPILDKDGNYNGMISIDNPSKNLENTYVLRSLNTFVSNFLTRNELLDKLNTLSYYDSLTGLKNRHLYRNTLSSFEKTPPSSLGVLYADINGLKDTNDVLGIKAGDELIKTMANLLVQHFGDIVYRIAGDEFVVLCENISEEDFNIKVNNFKAKLSISKPLKASIGSVWNSTEKSADISKQIDTADAYMYADKQGYYNYRHSNTKYSNLLSENLKKELADNKFVVFLQPQIDLQTNKIVGAESLIRRIGTNGEMQLPYVFIPLFEKEGIISQLDHYMFESICKLIKKWSDDGHEHDIKVAVNLSRLTVFEEGIVGKLSSVCQKYGISPSNIVIEITESIRTAHSEKLSEIIVAFSEAGFYVSLDDFGSGYSNLAIIASTTFDEIKIDKSLIDELTSNEKSRILTKLSVDLCDKLEDTSSLAEGIELFEQYSMLKNMNCKKGQGYYFDRPMPVDAFEQKYVVS